MSKNEKKPYRKETYESFIEWSLLTHKEKQELGLLTAKAFAKKHNIGEDRLSKWKKRKDFTRVRKEQLRLMLMDKTGDVLNSLKERCIKHGYATDVELWLLYVEGWDRKQASKVEILPKIAPGDIRALIDTLPENERQPFYDMLTELLVKAQEYRFGEL